MELTARATGALPVAQAWERYVHPDRWPTWAPQIRRVVCADPTLRPGTTGRVIGPVGFAVEFEVLTVEPAVHRWSWRVRVETPRALSAIRLTLQHTVFQESGRTATTAVINGPGWVTAPYLPVASFALHRLLRS